MVNIRIAVADRHFSGFVVYAVSIKTIVMSTGAKRITVNIGCKDITLIISRYVEHASTWRGISEPSTAACDS